MPIEFPIPAGPASAMIELPLAGADSGTGPFALDLGSLLMPQDGIGYVVQLSPDRSRMRILAYEDRYCRVFATDRIEHIPPARYPSIQAFAGEERAGEPSEYPTDVYTFTDGGAPEPIAQALSRTDAEGRVEMRATALTGQPAGDASPLFEYRRAFVFAAMAYLAFCGPVETGALFSMKAIENRLMGTTLLDGLNAEALHVDLADEKGACGLERYLVHLLREEGLVGASEADLRVWPAGDALLANSGEEPLQGPAAELIRTSRTADLFYVRYRYKLHGDTVDDGAMLCYPPADGARRWLLGTEAALNRFALIARSIEEAPNVDFSADEGWCARQDVRLFERICDGAPDPAAPACTQSAWDVHLNFARAMERLALPYRAIYTFQTDDSLRHLAVELHIPAEAMMPKSKWDDATGAYAPTTEPERCAMEAQYASRLILAVAACAFHAQAGIQTVSVDAKEDAGERPTVMNGTIYRSPFVMEWAYYAHAGFPRPLASVKKLGIAFEQNEAERLLPIEETRAIGKGRFEPWADGDPQASLATFNARARELFGARRPADAGIDENSERKRAGARIIWALRKGVGAAEEDLKSIHDRTEDLVLRGQCQRLLEGFAAGLLDAHSFQDVRATFNDPYHVQAKLDYAESLYKADNRRAVDEYKSIIETIQSQSSFEDGAFAVHRYFPDYAARVIYVSECANDAPGTVVRPLPRAVYQAHERLARISLESGDFHDAYRYGEKCRLMAPSDAHAYMLVARALQMEHDWEASIEFCEKAMSVSSDANTTGICLYWIAFSWWQLERYELAAAAYGQSIVYPSSALQHARTELDSLKAHVKGIPRLAPARRLALLRGGGVPVDALDRNIRRVLDAARAATDSGAIALGFELGKTANAYLHRDELACALAALEHQIEPIGR